MSLPSWKIWVDTGGTFTDCIAFSPQGDTRRLKVLSSGVLKGRVLNKIDSNTFAVQLNWPVKVDIFKNFTIQFTRLTEASYSIESADIERSIIHLQHSVNPSIDKGDVFEIGSGEEVPVFAARLLTSTSLLDTFPPIELKLGSTRGTNALLERKGARVAFITTKGFKDLLLIGTQQRTNLFALHIIKQKPLYEMVIEADERVEADGVILKALVKEEVNRIVRGVTRAQCDSIAIAFVNSYVNPAHEQILAEELLKHGYSFISTSQRLSGQIKILQRAETAVANAYLEPIIHSYISNIQRGLQQAQLRIMTSAGGLVNAQHFFPKDSLLSGPAGGVVGAATVAKFSGVDQLITFDMGGTSTDVSLYNKRFTYRYESKVGEIKIFSPSLAIETIAAGGGSICEFDGHRLTVGPQSAGASPGPACYGSGGPLTVTDVNLLLGRAEAEFFSIPLYRKKSEEALENLLEKIKRVTGKGRKQNLYLSLSQSLRMKRWQRPSKKFLFSKVTTRTIILF